MELSDHDCPSRRLATHSQPKLSDLNSYVQSIKAISGVANIGAGHHHFIPLAHGIPELYGIHKSSPQLAAQ